MARALDQIMSELNSVYNPQRQSINKQIGALDPQQQAEQQGLEAAKSDAFNQITDTANRRGLFYSGIPVKEQQQYTGANFLPAVANLKNRYAQQRFSLQNALNDLGSQQYQQAWGMRQDELANEQAAASARAAAAAASPSFGFSGLDTSGSVLGQQSPYTMSQRSGGGFNFTYNGQPISAAQYAQNNGISFRDLLSTMAQAGDSGARAALGLVGNDYGFNRSKINSQNQVNLLNALGVNTSGYKYTAPKAQSPTGTTGAREVYRQATTPQSSTSLLDQLRAAFTR